MSLEGDIYQRVQDWQKVFKQKELADDTWLRLGEDLNQLLQNERGAAPVIDWINLLDKTYLQTWTKSLDFLGLVDQVRGLALHHQPLKFLEKTAVEAFLSLLERISLLSAPFVNLPGSLTPEVKTLMMTVASLKEDLAQAILAQDHLRLVVCENIKRAYLLALGDLEYQTFQKHCQVLRLKRKKEWIQLAINHQQAPNLADIEQKLDQEFEAFQKELDKKLDQINDALSHQGGRLLTLTESRELKRLYRKIMKVLHPDMQNNLSPAQKQLFAHALEAYKNGDLAAIKLIAGLVSLEQERVMDSDKEALIQQKASLEASLASVQAEIERIKSQYPYTLIDKVEDPDWIANKKAEFEATLDHLDREVAYYEAQIAELLEA